MGLPVKNLRDGVLIVADDGGTAGADKITVVLDEGNLSWDEASPVDMILDRGTLDHARKGNDVPVAGQFGFMYTTHLDPNSATITPYEAMTQQGSAAGWGSDASNGGDAYACILEFTIADPAGGVSEVVTFSEVYVENIAFAEGTPFNTMIATFRALQTRPDYT